MPFTPRTLPDFKYFNRSQFRVNFDKGRTLILIIEKELAIKENGFVFKFLAMKEELVNQFITKYRFMFDEAHWFWDQQLIQLLLQYEINLQVKNATP